MGQIKELYCKCCGKKIKLCPHCPTEAGYTPWRTLADSQEHFKLFMLACDYANKAITKDEALAMLHRLDVTGYEHFNTSTGEILRELLSESQNIQTETSEEMIKPAPVARKRSRRSSKTMSSDSN